MSEQEPTTMHAAIALGSGNKAKTTIQKTDGTFTLVVQELGVLQFRWWVIESDGHVIENNRLKLEHLGYQGVDPYANIWIPV